MLLHFGIYFCKGIEMAFTDYEYSVDNSRPDELYDFEYEGSSTHYRITSSAFNVDFGGYTYKSGQIKRSNIKRTAEVGKSGLTVLVERNDAFFNKYISGSLTYKTSLTLYTMQDDGSYIVAWKGIVKSVSKTTEEIRINCNPVSVNSSRPVLHRKYQSQCPHDLGDNYCGVDLESYKLTGAIGSISGTTITSSVFSSEASGWLTGGEIVVGSERKTIIKHTTDTIETLDAFFDVDAGDSFTAYAGCAHVISVCDSKFSNHLNYGGCPFIPVDDDITKGKPFTY